MTALESGMVVALRRDTPLVSIVIPCRNAAAWIADTLDSVFSQANVRLEVIVVDDGSDDDSVAIVETRANPSLTIIRQNGLGASQAKNAGTRAASGEFVQYLDADDVLIRDTLQQKVAALVESGGDVAYTNWVQWIRQANGTFIDGETVCRRLGPRPEIDIIGDAWWPPGALLYRRALVDRIMPWRVDLPIIQDARFLLDAALAGASFTHVDVLGLKYRVHGGGSLSRRDPRAFLEDIYRSTAELDAVWCRELTLDDERRRALVKVYAFLARSFFAVDRARFATIVARLLALDPSFLPEQPPAFRLLSRVVGYPAAEHVAAPLRRIRNAVGGAKLTLSPPVRS